MKIALTTQGENLDSSLDPRFGRAASFIIYDNADRSWCVIENNRSLNLTQGAGIQAAQTIVGEGVEALITGHCGPKAFRALQAAGIDVWVGAKGTVAQALADFAEGRLRQALTADVEGHW